MAWSKEYSNWCSINFNGSIVRVYKDTNSYIEINLGHGLVVESANWSLDDVKVVYNENGQKKSRKYVTNVQYIQL